MTLLAAAPASAAVRVDQLGYAPGEHKVAYAIGAERIKRFTVVDTRGHVVLDDLKRKELGDDDGE